MTNLMELLKKEILTCKELEQVEENHEISIVENYGMSEDKVGFRLYKVTLANGEERNVYIKVKDMSL